MEKVIITEEKKMTLKKFFEKSKDESRKYWASLTPQQLKDREEFGRHFFKQCQSSFGL